MIKKTAFILAAVLASLSMLPASAAETWRDGFVTRLMNIMTRDPAYTDLVMTDLDSNGVPEVFAVKPGASGGIGGGITMKDNTVVNINVPSNVIGTCLEDITVYDVDGSNCFVGREISRYASKIDYYQLVFDGASLSCIPIDKNTYSSYPSLAYQDVYSSNFLRNGFPDRTKIRDFVYGYDIPTQITVKPSTAAVSVNGSIVDVSGFNVNYNNYYKIRDIAMVLRTTGCRFDVSWDSQKNAVSIHTGVKYNIVGGELAGTDSSDDLNIQINNAPIYVNGEEIYLDTYNINGSNYVKIRDLADIIGFTVGWDEASQTVLITTN